MGHDQAIAVGVFGTVLVLSRALQNTGPVDAAMRPVALPQTNRDGSSPANALMPPPFGSLLGGSMTSTGT